MTKKITLHIPVFTLLTSAKKFEFKTPKYWTDLIQNIISIFRKTRFFNHSRTIYTKIDLIMKVNQFITISQPSIYPKTLRSNIYY